MTAPRPAIPCLLCARLGIRGEELYRHPMSGHAAALREQVEKERLADEAARVDDGGAGRDDVHGAGVPGEAEAGGHPLVAVPGPERADALAGDRAPVPDAGVAPRDPAAVRAAWAGVAADLARVEGGVALALPVGPLSPADEAARLAVALAPGDLGYVLLVDMRAVAAGKPPMSPWWRYSVGDFFASGKPWGWWQVGRGGGKSTTLEIVAAALSRYSRRSVPPGQTWTVPFVSVGPDDANRRVDGIAAAFKADGLQIIGDVDAEGVKIKEGVKITRAPRYALDLIDIRGNPIRLASVAGTIGNLSGPSTVFLLIDEAAKLLDERTHANPLTEIIASAAQTSRARPGWRGIVSSSAWEKSGVHFDTIEAGENEVNFIARIGETFLAETRAGFESVASWEYLRGDKDAAQRIREHAASLTAASPYVPTWTAFPGFGNPERDGEGRLTGAAWAGAALATRKLVEVLPEKALGGIPRVLYWLRENGSVALDKTERAAVMSLEDAQAFVAWNQELARPAGSAPTSSGMDRDGLLLVPGYEREQGEEARRRHRGL